MNEYNRQERAAKLIEREVICRVTQLVQGITKLSFDISGKKLREALDTDSDQLIEMCQRPDYETAALDFISGATEADLETIVGPWQWQCLLDDACVPKSVELAPDADGSQRWVHEGLDPEVIFDCESDAVEVAISGCLPKIRQLIKNMTLDYEEVCRDFNLDPEYREALEHWAVSPWLYRRLDAKGEIVGELGDLCVWGRCCSGQSLRLDVVIQDIAEETS